MTRPTTASPRNSSDSLSTTPPVTSSCARDRCVRACSSSVAIDEAMADARLERGEALALARLVAPRRRQLAPALDQPSRRVGDRRRHGHRDVVAAGGRRRHDRPDAVGRDHRLEAVRLEQAAHDRGLDRGPRAEDDLRIDHAGAAISPTRRLHAVDRQHDQRHVVVRIGGRDVGLDVAHDALAQAVRRPVRRAPRPARAAAPR